MWRLAAGLAMAGVLSCLVWTQWRLGRADLFGSNVERRTHPRAFAFALGLWVLVAIAAWGGVGRVAWEAAAGAGRFRDHAFLDVRYEAWPLAPFALLMGGLCVAWWRRELRFARERRAKAVLHASLVALIDVEEADPEALTPGETVELFDIGTLEEILGQLRAMPPGERSLARALAEDPDSSPDI